MTAADEPLDENEEAVEGETSLGHPVAYAANWKTVLVVDASLGVALLVVGVALAIMWNPVIGGFIGSLGLLYVAFIAKRAQQWRELRRRAGLD